jgi:hypothetical protein
LTNLHNASAAGLANDNAIGLHGSKVLGKKKGPKKVVTLLQKHKNHNRFTKKKKNSQSALLYSKNDLKKGMKRAGKIVKNLPHISERTRKIALKRLQRLHVALRPKVQGVALLTKKEAEKK